MQIGSSFTALRKQLPLSFRSGYGWLRRQFLPHRIWNNPYFRERYAWLQETEWWTLTQLEQYQLAQLQDLVRHAYEHVPYYRRTFDALKLKPADIRSLVDLRKIPVLSKEDVRRNLEDLVARNVDRQALRYETTGGSTGEPLGLYQDYPQAYLRELAFYYRQWNWAGYRFGDRFATLARGTIPIVKVNGDQAVWDYRNEINELILSSTEMHEANMLKYVKLLETFHPKFMCVYPSSAEIFARFLKRHGFHHIQFDAVFSDAETLYPRVRDVVESQLGCKIFDHYGLTERVADAMECEQHNGYHVNMEYGILELVDGDHQPITKAGTLGTVVGTGFGNYAMPLLRYLTTDLALYATGPCACGRDTHRIAEFRGRIGDYIVSKIGRLVPVNMLLGGHSLVWAKVCEIKLRQERAGELIAMVVTLPSCAASEVSQEVREELYRVLHTEQFDVRVEIVDSIPRTGSRVKLPLLEQHLPIKFAELNEQSASAVEPAA